MGIFDAFKKQQPQKDNTKKSTAPAPEPTKKPKVEPDKYYEMAGYKFHFPVDKSESTTSWILTISLSEKYVKIPVAEQEIVEKVYLWHEENLIRGVVGDDTIFEITNRCKDYPDVLPFAKRKAKTATITRREGQYGTFYKVSLKFEIVVDDSGLKYT